MVPDGYRLRFSFNADRTDKINLDGVEIVQDGLPIYVLLEAPANGPELVSFYLDGAFQSDDALAPFDMRGGSLSAANPYYPAIGERRVTADVNANNGGTFTVAADFLVSAPTPTPVATPTPGPLEEGTNLLVISFNPDRSNPVELDGLALPKQGLFYIYFRPAGPDADVVQVNFFLDGELVKTETRGPFDFQGGPEEAADDWNPPQGRYEIQSTTTFTDDSVVVLVANFTVGDPDASSGGGDPVDTGPTPSPTPFVPQDTVTLTWGIPSLRDDGSNLPFGEIDHYEIHYGNSASSFPNSVVIADPLDTSYVFNNLPSGRYFFVIRVADTSGHISTFSNVVEKTVVNDPAP